MHPAPLPLAAYRAAVALDEPLRPGIGHAADDRSADLVREALGLLGADPAAARAGLYPGAAERLDDATAPRVLRAVLTVRESGPLPTGTARVLDALLTGERLARHTAEVNSLPTIRDALPLTTYRADDRTVLWQGVVTTPGADAVVNAASSALLGCFVPMHSWIDNAVHAAAGPRRRADCHAIMSLQGHPEPTGGALRTSSGRPRRVPRARRSGLAGAGRRRHHRRSPRQGICKDATSACAGRPAEGHSGLPQGSR